VFARVKANLSNLFAGDLTLLGGPQVSPEVAGYLRAEQVALIKRNSAYVTISSAGSMLVLGGSIAVNAPSILALSWTSMMLALFLYFGVKAWVQKRAGRPQSVSRRSIQRLCKSALVMGLFWGGMSAVVEPNVDYVSQQLINCVVTGVLAGGALAFATLPIVALLFMAPILTGLAIGFMQAGGVLSLLHAILLGLYVFVLLRSVFLHAFEFTEKTRQRAEAEAAIRHDILTGLPNGFAFHEKVLQACSRLELTGKPFSVLLLDIASVRNAHDAIGQTISDQILVQLSSRLQLAMRSGDVLARLNGDDFGVIAADVDSADAVFAIAQSLSDIVREPLVINGRSLVASVCIGIACAPRDGTLPSEVTKHADQALHHAKKDGETSIRFFEPADDNAARDARELLRDLEGAVARGELWLAYQPILTIENNRIAGFEALLRWNHPQRGMVPPNVFIGLAEESGLIHPIGDWVVQQACRDLARWPEDIRIAVNFSVAQLQNPNRVHGILQSMARSEIAPHRFEIEITESMLISKYATAAATLDTLLALGITVALDDFGTGFSSLTYLRKFPFSRIKIDQSFVADMLVQPDSAAIVKSVLTLAHDMKIGVVAEGIETPEQLAFFKASSCEAVQGYFIGRPMPVEQATALVGSLNASVTEPGVSSQQTRAA
jgi:diguanylate cyclase (GGDEF)-like protein